MKASGVRVIGVDVSEYAVKKAMENPNPLKTKSITLSCGKLTTGVTIKPWAGIFMLRNTSSPETYFQAAFRIQSPWTIENSDGLHPNDEEILTDSLGNLLESPADSYWGEYNDVKQIKVTWDASYLYLAVDACSWNNNVMLFIDIYDDYGIEDMSEVNAWQRSFKFYNWNPDFLVGTWDTNDIPQFWKVQEGGTMQVEQIPTIETSATFDTGNLFGAMEMKIAWEILFFDEEHSLQNKLRFHLHLSKLYQDSFPYSSSKMNIRLHPKTQTTFRYCLPILYVPSNPFLFLVV